MCCHQRFAFDSVYISCSIASVDDRVCGYADDCCLPHRAANWHADSQLDDHTNPRARIAPIDDGRLLRHAVVVVGWEASAVH